MSNTDRIPFLDLVDLHRPLEGEFQEVFLQAVRTGRFIGGPEVEGFENEFAEFCGTGYCVGVNSGTDALRFALTGLGIGEGEVVITAAHTFIATSEAISQVGAVPEFLDVDPVSYNLDPFLLREYLENSCTRDKASGQVFRKSDGRRVGCVIPVHLYGQPADMDSIHEAASEFGLEVLEDSCQAHGAEYLSSAGGTWKRAGSLARAAAFSFYPGKNLGALGEGGAVTTDDPELARTVRMLRDHGQSRKYYHDFEGYNGRLDSIQAGMLRIKLRHLADWNEQRRSAASFYNQGLREVEKVIVPVEGDKQKHVYHLYVIQVPDRKGLMEFLEARSIFTGLHYPVPLHLQRAYVHLGYRKGDLPITEEICERIISLPMFPGLEREQQTRIIAAVAEFASRD